MEQLPPGVYSPDELSNERYHQLSAISKSDLDKIARSPAHYLYKKQNPEPDTYATRRGRAVHAAVLEPDLFARSYAPEVVPADFPDALRTVEEVRNALVTYNQSLKGIASAQDLRDLIEQHNASLPAPIKGRKKEDKAAALQERNPELDAEELEKLPAPELQALVDDYNSSLPAPLKATKSQSRAELLDIVEQFAPDYAAEQRSGPQPASIDGTKQDLVEALAIACPHVQVWDRIRDEHLQAHQGAEFIARADYEKYQAMRAAVMAHRGAAYLLGLEGRAEYSILATDPETGEPVRIRPDYWVTKGPRIIVDLKTSEDARREAFARSAVKYRYDVQAAYYSDVYEWHEGAPLDAFVFVVVEDKPPHGVAVYYAGPRMIARGRYLYRQDLNRTHECRERDEWPGYTSEAQQLELPGYADRLVDELDLLPANR